MDEIKAFFDYPLICLRWTITTWWKLFKSQWGWPAVLSLAVFMAGSFLHAELVKKWPDLATVLGNPMNTIWSHFVYGAFALVCVMGCVGVGLLVAAPSQIYLEHRRKIKELTPPPLNIMLEIGKPANSTTILELDEAALTNRSARSMNLTFDLHVNFKRTTDGQQSKTTIQGKWFSVDNSLITEHLAVNSDSKVVGRLSFMLPPPHPLGVSRWVNVSLDVGCVLEIKDAISGAVGLCKPTEGFPQGLLT
jgi:hypothetical protein